MSSLDMLQVTNPRARRAELPIGLAIFAATLMLYSIDWFHSLSNWNFHLKGGVSTIGAERILAGDVPYRDFWTMYAPGHFYLVAALFRIFGTYLLVEVIAASVICAFAALLCYRIAFRLVDNHWMAAAAAAVFAAAVSSTGYSERLGSYPPAILLIFITLYFLISYYRRGRIGCLIAAGLATGLAAVFKHDVAGYTAVAVAVGLLAYHLTGYKRDTGARSSFLRGLVVYAISAAIVVLPVLILFIQMAGEAMLEDLVIFPLTDFRFARPEGYPSIIPSRISADTPIDTVQNLVHYINFALPFFLFLVGLAAVFLAVRRRNAEHVALSVTLSVGFLLHYVAAHVQINTHIVTMSVYGALLGLILYDLTKERLLKRARTVVIFFGTTLFAGWLLSLAARPAYIAWRDRDIQTSQLASEKVKGFRVSQEEAEALNALTAYTRSRVAPNQKLFVGLHRHDVIVIGDVMVYFLLDRPIATRYHELHPAIADTAAIQQEIIEDLQEDNVKIIVLRHIFPDATLDEVKRNFLENLPQIGATDLDDFIQQEYAKGPSFGPYDVWILKEATTATPTSGTS